MEFPLEYELKLVSKGKAILSLDCDNENRLKNAIKMLKLFCFDYKIRRTRRGYHIIVFRNGDYYIDDVFKILCLRCLLRDDEFRVIFDYFRYKNGCKKIGILFDKKIYL
ncbi:MAG: hypothetical protein QW734_07795 [Candidatus Bathyarchaeia archaeon]